MSAKYKSPSFLLPNELNTSANPANDTGINSLYSMDFNGSSDYIDVGNPTELQLTGAFSVSLWMKTIATGTGAFVAKDNNASNPRGFSVEFNNSAPGGYFVIYNGTTTYGVYVFSSDANYINIRDNNWHHIVAVYTPSTSVALFVDGNFVKSNTTNIPASVNFVNDNLNIGRRPQSGGVNYYQGKLDEVAIFNRALSTTEIAALYDGSGSNIRPSNLMATDLGPIAYYPLGEQAQNTGYLDPNNPGNDIAGSEWQFPNGVLQDYVMDFDSTSPGDYISAPMTMLNSATQCTISFWGKKDASNKILCIGDQITNSQGIWLMWYSDGNIYFSPRGTGGSNFGLTYAQSYDNNWHHYLAVYNGSSATNCKLYLDGDLVATGSGTAPSSLPAATGNAFKIGALISSSFYSDGQISNVAVWNTAITDVNQISNIYNNGSPQTTYTVTPQNWWKLNADSVYTPSAPNYTAALDFDGTNDYINCGNDSSLNITSNLSVSAWFKTSVTGGNKTIVNRDPGYNNRVWQLGVNSSNQVYVHFRGSSFIAVASSNTYTDGKWHHVVGIYEPSVSVKLYIDGDLVSTNTTNIPASLNDEPNTPLYIGAYSNFSGEKFNGEISNVAIFDSGLTDSQISTLFNFGTPETNISFSPTAWWKLDNTTTGIQDSSGNGNNGTNNGATDISSGVAVTPSWKIPTALNIPTINYTTALNFDGNTNYVTAGTTSYLNNVTEMSLSIWFNLDTAAENKGIIDDQDKHLAIYTKTVSGSDYSLRINLNGSANRFQLTGTPFTAGKWHNLLMTFNAGTLNFYIDGNSSAYNVYSGSIPSSLANNTGTLNIGKYSSLEWDGLISNAQIWITELSSSDALSIYNNGQPSTTAFGSPVSWWKLDSTTITDSVGSNNGTNNGATQVTSDVYAENIPVNGVSTTLPSTALQQSDLQFDSPYSNYSLYFDGTTGIQCGDIPQLNSATKLSFNVWLNYENMAYRIIFSKEDSTNAIRLYNWGSGILYFWLKNSGTGTVSFVNNFSSLVNLNEWNMLTVVYDGTQTSNNDRVKIFLNGGSSNILTDYGTIPTSTGNTTDSFAIGEYSSASGSKFLGKLDETSIFNTALTSAEILEIYNNGRPKDLTTFSGTALISWWRLGENAYFQDSTLVLPNSIIGAPNGEASTNNLEMISADAPGTYANGIGTNLAILDRVGDAPLSTSNSQSYNMIPDDKSPYVPGYVGLQTDNIYSMDFDSASSDYIDTNYILDVTSDFSVSTWIKIDGNSDHNILGTREQTTGASVSKGFTLSLNSSKQIYARIFTTTSSITQVNAGVIQVGQWFNVVATYVASTKTLKIYRNGIEMGSVIGTSAGVTSPDNLSIGRVGIGGIYGYFDGKIDEVAIFDKALSAGQIFNDLYQPTATATNKTADLVNNPNLPTPVAWYRMGD